MARKVGSSGKHATTAHQSAASKLAQIKEPHEPKDINYHVDAKLTTYNFRGKGHYDWDISENVLDIRVLPDTTQASTVEIDLDDSDYELLQDPLFSHWAFNIQDVSLSSTKKFKTSRLSNSVNNQFLGDNSDLEWVMGQRPIDFTIGDVTFRLCGLSTSDTVLTLTFEDKTASALRDKKGFKTVSRGSSTRAEFVASLCREAKVDFWIPEIHEEQPVAMSPTPKTGHLSRTGKTRLVTGKGLHTGQGLSAKGSPLGQSNIDVANTILDTGAKLGANTVALEAAMCAAILESGLTVDPGNGSYAGALAGSVHHFLYTDTVGMATAFFQGDGGKGYQAGGAIHLSKTHNDPMYIASQVEAPTPFDSHGISTQYEGETGFHLVAGEAAKIVQNYGGAPSVGSVVAATFKGGEQNLTYSFTRGPNEDSYDCIQRLAAEVAWYAFVRQNRLWYVSGDYLFEQDPQMTVERGKNGIDTIDPNLDMGARDAIAQCTISGRADLWAALPGMLVQVNKRGPATGKWFVASVESHPLDLSQQVTITLQKPVPRRAEPAATDKALSNPLTNSTGNSSSLGTGGTSNPAPGATWGRLDMGFDGNYGSAGAVAPYSGTVHWDRRGWPGQGDYIWIRNDDQSGADYTRAIYFAEGASHSIQDGQHVRAGQQVGRPVASGGNGTPGNFEIGPANTTNGEALVKSYGLGSNRSRATVLAFEQWVHGLGGGLSTDRSNAGRP